jgi:hypothetical protein
MYNVHVQDAAQSRHFYLCFFLCVCRLAGGQANGVVRYRGVQSAIILAVPMAFLPHSF